MRENHHVREDVQYRDRDYARQDDSSTRLPRHPWPGKNLGILFAHLKISLTGKWVRRAVERTMNQIIAIIRIPTGTLTSGTRRAVISPS